MAPVAPQKKFRSNSQKGSLSYLSSIQIIIRYVNIGTTAAIRDANARNNLDDFD